jgi:hypothetical protein
MRFRLFCFSILTPFFRGSFFLLGRDSTNWNFLGESLGKEEQSWAKKCKRLIWSLWNAWWIMPFLIRMGITKHENMKARKQSLMKK